MARKPATATADHTPPAMDYAQHQATYNGFLKLVKFGILSMAFLVVALYCFIEAHQPILGTILLLLIPASAVAASVMGSRRT